MSAPRRYSVRPEDRGRRLDSVLAAAWPDLSRSRVQALIQSARVLVDGVPVRASDRPRPGSVVEAHLPDLDLEPTRVEPEAIPLSVVYEDGHLLVIDKPAGLVVHPGAGVRRGTLANALVARLPGIAHVGSEVRPGIVHRLDRDTSGLLVVAKTGLAYQRLTRALAERSIRRLYQALVWGVPRPPEARIEAPIGRDPRERKRMAVVPAGRPGSRLAASRYRVLEELPSGWARPRFAWIEVELETGRTHQVRVHLAHRGHPVVADATYGGGVKKALSLPPAERRLAHEILELVGRQALHAATLELAHPVDGRLLRFHAPLPAHLAQALTVLRRPTRS